MNSIGFKFGEYGGIKTRYMPSSLAFCLTSALLWDEKLSVLVEINAGLGMRVWNGNYNDKGRL